MSKSSAVSWGKKLLFSALAGVLCSGGGLLVAGVGIAEGWWLTPPALHVVYWLVGAFLGCFLAVFTYLLQIAYYEDHDDNMI